jgi:tRNA(adenine34) deaminase
MRRKWQMGGMTFKLPKGMAIAFEEAEAAAQRGEVPVGACVVSTDGHVLARDGNRTRELRDPTAHAEVLVLRQAAAKVASERLVDCDLFVTLEPCVMCAGAISHARIRRLYYGAEDAKMGAVDHGPRVFIQSTCHHAPDVYGGIGATAASSLLKDFFKSHR